MSTGRSLRVTPAVTPATLASPLAHTPTTKQHSVAVTLRSSPPYPSLTPRPPVSSTSPPPPTQSPKTQFRLCCFPPRRASTTEENIRLASPPHLRQSLFASDTANVRSHLSHQPPVPLALAIGTAWRTPARANNNPLSAARPPAPSPVMVDLRASSRVSTLHRSECPQLF